MMLIIKPGIALKVFMVKTPQGIRPRYQRGQDRMSKDRKNAVGLQAGTVTTVADEMFLITIGDRDHTIYMCDVDFPGFIDV